MSMTYERALAALTDKQIAKELEELAHEYGHTDDGQTLSEAMLMMEASRRLSEKGSG